MQVRSIIPKSNDAIICYSEMKCSIVSIPVVVAIAPIRTEGMAITTHPTPATYDRILALNADLADNTR